MRRVIPLSAEAQAVADDLARRGIEPVVGTPLPVGLSPAIVQEIAANVPAFRLAYHMALAGLSGTALQRLDADIKAKAQATAAQLAREEMELTLRGKQAPQQPQAEPIGLFAQRQEELF